MSVRNRSEKIGWVSVRIERVRNKRKNTCRGIRVKVYGSEVFLINSMADRIILLRESNEKRRGVK